MEKPARVYEYQIKHLLLEADYEETKRRLASRRSLPDIDAIYRSRFLQAPLFRLQQLIWTLRSLRQRHGAEDTSVAKSNRLAAEPLVKSSTGGRNVYLDVTAAESGKVTGGIKTVARALAGAAARTGAATPVVVCEDAIRTLEPGHPGDRINFQAGDVFAIVDHYWDAFASYPHLLGELRQRGVLIAACIHDLIPLEYPALVNRDLSERMRHYLPIAVDGSDLVFSVSRSAAADIAAYAVENRIANDLHVVSFCLGVNDTCLAPEMVQAPLASAFNAGERTFISVGSMMPHKAHRVAVEAFARLWAAGSTDTYVIIGPKSEESSIEAFIRTHRYYGTRLFRVDDAMDEEIVWAYRNALALVQPSIAEGFGLPVIEANRNGLPIIASDIPVFREIGCDSLCYFDVCDSQMLARTIAGFDPKPWAGQTTQAITWDESLMMLCRVLLERADALRPEA